MDIKQIHYFLRVAELGSFTKAAPVLGLTQPALSWQVGKLETELGVELLSRNGRGVNLTDAGVVFLRRAKALVEDADLAKREIHELVGCPMGIVRIGFPPAIGALITLPLVERVKKLCPEVQLQILEGYSGYIHEWLLSGRVDIGILYDAGRTPSLDCEPLANERLYLLQSAKHVESQSPRIQFAHLRNVPLILPSQPHAIRRLLDQYSAQHRMRLNIRMEVTAFSAIRNLVIEGHGATVLSIAPVISDVKEGRIRAREIIKPTLSQVVGLAASAQHPDLATKSIAKIISQIAADLVANGQWPERLPNKT